MLDRIPNMLRWQSSAMSLAAWLVTERCASRGSRHLAQPCVRPVCATVSEEPVSQCALTCNTQDLAKRSKRPDPTGRRAGGVRKGITRC